MVKVEQFITEARSWINTPWVQNQACKGKGVDCVRLPYAAAISVGIELKDPGNYSNDPVGEKLLERLGEQLTLIGVVKESYNWSTIPITKFYSKPELLSQSRAGDILVFTRGWKGAPGHLSIKTDYGKIQAKLSQGG